MYETKERSVYLLRYHEELLFAQEQPGVMHLSYFQHEALPGGTQRTCLPWCE